jgi:hypothetical protein
LKCEDNEMKAYVKVKKDYNSGLIVGHSQNIQKAISGFNELACEVVPYYSLDDVYDQICREDIVVDYIQFFKNFIQIPFTIYNTKNVYYIFSYIQKIVLDTISNQFLSHIFNL